MNILKKVTIYDWMKELNLRGSDLYVYAAYSEAGERGISICAETESAAGLLGMHISTFTRTRERLFVAGLIILRDLPGRNFAQKREGAAVPMAPKPAFRSLSEPGKPVKGFAAPGYAEDVCDEEEVCGACTDGETETIDGEIGRTVEAILSRICDFVKILGTEVRESGRVREGLADTLEKTHDTLFGLDGEVCAPLEDVSGAPSRRKK